MKQIYKVRTFEEARNLADIISKLCPSPSNSSMGICEIILNAIEHGNLGITSEQKQQMQKDGTWLQQVEKKLNSEENKHKYVTVTVVNAESEISITVKDEGEGFDWNQQQNRGLDNQSLCGRGIQLAKSMTFDKLTYSGNGNTVTGIIKKS